MTPSLKGLASAAACALLAACTGLPEPDGTEAAILARGEAMTPLAAADGADLSSAARNGLMLDPKVREAASDVSASADEVRVQRAAFFPSLGLSLGTGIGEAGSGAVGGALTGSQLIFDGGETSRAVQVADFDLQIRYLAFQQAVDAALVELLRAFDEVQRQAERLTVYRGQLAALRELEALVASRVEIGAVPATDLLESRRRTQSAMFLVNDAELAHAEARDRLILMSGQPGGGRVAIAAGACTAPQESRPIQIARLEEGRAALALTQAEHALTPRVSLQPVVQGRMGNAGLPVGLNLDVQSDLLEGGALTARANAARNTLEAARARLDVAHRESVIEEGALRRSLAAGAREDQMLAAQIDLLAETRDLYRRQYVDMGTRQLSELLDIEEELHARRAERVDLRSELTGHRLDCAVRGGALRAALDLEGYTLYGFPLSTEPL